MAITRKRFIYKLYYSSTDIRSVWEDEVISEPSFRMVINGGPGEMVVRLDRDFDSFGEGDEIVLNRQVDVYVYDTDVPNGTLLYRGYISGYSPVIDGSTEYVEITLLGYVVETGFMVLHDSDGYTGLQYYNEDPSNIFKDVIDKYRALDSGTLLYTDSSVGMTGTTVTYLFNIDTIQSCLEKCVQLAPDGWYYRIDPAGTCYFKKRSATADHKFFIGKHISYVNPKKRLEDVYNRVYFVGGVPPSENQLYRLYNRTGSQGTYGIKAIKMIDQRVTLDETADTMVGRFLDANEAPRIRTSLRIMDNNGENPDLGYNIESINPGDTLSIENLKSSTKVVAYWDQAQWDVSKWDFDASYVTADILHITSVTYYPDYCDIEAERRLPEVSKEIRDIRKHLDDTITSDVPLRPTEV